MTLVPDFTNPTAIIMGSEEDGKPRVFKMSDSKFSKIPMKGKISSLNVSRVLCYYCL